MKNLEKLNESKIRLRNIYSSYSVGKTSLLDLLHDFFVSINDCIDNINDIVEILKWLIEEGVPSEVSKKIQELVENGTLANIINETLFGELNNKINTLLNGFKEHMVEYEELKINVDNNNDNISNLKIEVENIKENIPYKPYNKNDLLEDRDISNIYDGHNVFATKTYGTSDKASCTSIIVGEDYPTPEVLDTDVQGLSQYTNRDSVSLYVHNKGIPKLGEVLGCSFTIDSVIFPTVFNSSLLKKGMILESGDRYVSVVEHIEEERVVKIKSGWFKIGSGEKGVPSSDKCIISPTTKIWGVNSNLFVREGIPAGANMELGVFCSHSKINDVGGIDIINFEKAVHYGVKVRGRENGFLVGFSSNKSGVHFEGKDSKKDQILLRSINNDGSSWQVLNDGTMDSLTTKQISLNESGTITPNISFVRLLGNNINCTLPLQPVGRRLVIISEGTGNLITAPSGSGIKGGSLNQQQISIAVGSGKHTRTIELISIGNSWRILYDWQ